MIFEENVSAKDFSTFKVGGTIRYSCSIRTDEDLQEAIRFAENKTIPLIMIGEGSNTIWKDGESAVLVASFKTKNISLILDDKDFVIWEVDAGINWDMLVERSVSQGLYGIECMSGIPGTIGAAPIQNIGAYGQEIKDVLVSARVYDLVEKRFKVLDHSECNFSYRNSIFKTTEKGRYIISSVTIRFSKKKTNKPHYESLQRYFDEKRIIDPTLPDIRNAVLEIRSTKLPDLRKIPNCGSFFENPIIALEQANLLKKKYPDIKIFPTEEKELVKISAGWLIEKAGFKEKEMGNIVVYKNNALVLTNKGDATYDELLKAKDQIASKVKEMFGIELEMEPNVV